jgi:hypothetical protein
MKFLCFKQGQDSCLKPCDEAFTEPFTQTICLPGVLDPKLHHNWFKHGQNFRIENGKICKDNNTLRWYIDVVDILDFVREYKNCILRYDGQSFTVEICD